MIIPVLIKVETLVNHLNISIWISSARDGCKFNDELLKQLKNIRNKFKNLWNASVASLQLLSIEFHIVQEEKQVQVLSSTLLHLVSQGENLRTMRSHFQPSHEGEFDENEDQGESFNSWRRCGDLENFIKMFLLGIDVLLGLAENHLHQLCREGRARESADHQCFQDETVAFEIIIRKTFVRWHKCEHWAHQKQMSEFVFIHLWSHEVGRWVGVCFDFNWPVDLKSVNHILDANSRQTPSNSSSFYTFPDNEEVRENRQSFSKQSSVDNGSRNGDDVNSNRTSPDRPQPGTSKSFSASRAKEVNNSGVKTTKKMRNSHIHQNSNNAADIENDLQLSRPRSNSDSNLIEKKIIHNESSLLNVPKKSSCENCEKTRTKVKLKLCHALQQLEKIETNEETAIADAKEILNDTLESIDHITSYSVQSSSSSSTSSLDSSLSIIPMPESSDRNQEGSDTTLGMIQQEDASSLDTRQDVNIPVENSEEASQLQATIIEMERQNSLTLSPIESPVMAQQFHLPPKRFFTLDDVKSKWVDNFHNLLVCDVFYTCFVSRYFREELDDLSVKQLKEILTINRVNFKGCCEKQELKERVLRLWDDHVSSLRELITFEKMEKLKKIIKLLKLLQL